MTDEERKETGQAAAARSQPRQRWYKRPTIRTLKKRAGSQRAFHARMDERESHETRLPPGEAVHLGGIALTEAFTPSTISALYRALERWPGDRPEEKKARLERLASSRGGLSGGWQSLGVVRPPGSFLWGGGYHDPELPPGVDAVWLQLSYVTPSLAMVVATFTFAEASGDLSELLRNDYKTRFSDAHIQVDGRLGGVRARIPWSRPARYRVGHAVRRAIDMKTEACEASICELEDACSRWFFTRFRGRFAMADSRDRPLIRMLFTRQSAPYEGRPAWFRAIGLDFAFPLWRSADTDGWWLSQERWPASERRRVMTLAAKRQDASEEPDGESAWALTQQFHADQALLAALQALRALLGLYADVLGALRDNAGAQRLLRRPVAEARRLDDYLIHDGLDAATVTSDVEVLTRDVTSFRWGVPEYIETFEHLSGKAPDRERLEYVPVMRERMRSQAAQLASDADVTTRNIRASAELRQAIANTTLQRVILAISLVASVAAVVSLAVSLHS